MKFKRNLILLSYSNPHKDKKLSYMDNVALLSNIYINKLIDPTSTSIGEIKDHDSFISFLIMINFEQMRLQELPLYPLSRNIYIFNEIIQNDSMVNSTNIIELFEQKNGLSIPVFLSLSGILLAAGLRKPYFDINYFLKSKIPKVSNLLRKKLK